MCNKLGSKRAALKKPSFVDMHLTFGNTRRIKTADFQSGKDGLLNISYFINGFSWSLVYYFEDVEKQNWSNPMDFVSYTYMGFTYILSHIFWWHSKLHLQEKDLDWKMWGRDLTSSLSIICPIFLLSFLTKVIYDELGSPNFQDVRKQYT